MADAIFLPFRKAFREEQCLRSDGELLERLPVMVDLRLGFPHELIDQGAHLRRVIRDPINLVLCKRNGIGRCGRRNEVFA